MTAGRATVQDMKPDVSMKGSKHLWKGYFAFDVRDPEKRYTWRRAKMEGFSFTTRK